MAGPLIDTYNGLMQLNRQVRKEFRPIFLRERRVQLPPSRLVRYIEDFARHNPDYLPMDFSHIVLGTYDGFWENNVDLIALGKAASTQHLNLSGLNNVRECKTLKDLITHLLLRKEKWVPLLLDSTMSRLHLECNPAYMMRQSALSVFMGFNIPCDPHVSAAKAHREAFQPMAEAMGLDELVLGLELGVYTDFRDQTLICWKYDGNGLWNSVGPWWPDSGRTL
jgi:hypothetical protein